MGDPVAGVTAEDGQVRRTVAMLQRKAEGSVGQRRTLARTVRMLNAHAQRPLRCWRFDASAEPAA